MSEDQTPAPAPETSTPAPDLGTAGQAGDTSQAQSSASVTIPSIGATPEPTDAGDFKTQLGDLAGNPSLKDVKDVQSLAKMYLDTKTKVGQQSGPLPENATDEQKAEFWQSMGVPESAEAYEFTMPEDLPDAMKDSYDQEHADKWAQFFHENNVPKELAHTLRNQFFSEMSEQIGAIQEDATMSEDAFDKLATDIFGDKKLEAMDEARKTMEKFAPEELRKEMASMPNTALALVASTVNGILKEYTGEDKIVHGEGGGGQDIGSIRQELNDVIASKAYNDPFQKEAHHAARARASDLSKLLAAQGQTS